MTINEEKSAKIPKQIPRNLVIPLDTTDYWCVEKCHFIKIFFIYTKTACKCPSTGLLRSCSDRPGRVMYSKLVHVSICTARCIDCLCATPQFATGQMLAKFYDRMICFQRTSNRRDAILNKFGITLKDYRKWHGSTCYVCWKKVNSWPNVWWIERTTQGRIEQAFNFLIP